MVPILLFISLRQGPDTSTLDKLAQNRDVNALTAFETPGSLKPYNPLQVLKTNGPYEVGRFGWRVLDLAPPDKSKSYVVFTTPLTSEDVGEMVFEREGGL